jgi:hypothetical protein
MRSRPIGALSGALLLLPAAGSAQVQLTSQQRRVEAVSHSDGDLWLSDSDPYVDPPDLSLDPEEIDEVSAADFGSFSESANSNDPRWVSHLAMDGTATASQTSSLSASQLSASGSFAGTTDSYEVTGFDLSLTNLELGPPNYAIAYSGDQETATSSFTVGFDVVRPTSFHLTGGLSLSAAMLVGTGSGFPVSSGQAFLELRRDGGAVVAAIAIEQSPGCGAFCVPLSDSIDTAGILAPGSYTLTAEATGTATGICHPGVAFLCVQPPVEGSFDVALGLDATPVPALDATGLTALAICLACGGLASVRAVVSPPKRGTGRSIAT